jgi:hypothetical protein
MLVYSSEFRWTAGTYPDKSRIPRVSRVEVLSRRSSRGLSLRSTPVSVRSVLAVVGPNEYRGLRSRVERGIQTALQSYDQAGNSGTRGGIGFRRIGHGSTSVPTHADRGGVQRATLKPTP